MSYLERITNIINAFALYAKRYSNEHFRQYISADFPNLEELMTQSSFVFVNNDEYLDFSRVINQKIIYIGGIGEKPPVPFDSV
jgi:hypothetical protein